MTDLPNLRIALAESKIALRAARDTETLAKARSESGASAALNGSLGKNAEERYRNLILALNDDRSYQETLARLRGAESDVERLEAHVEAARDERRAEEWQIRAKLADALLRANIQSDDDDPSGDAAFDEAPQWLIERQAVTPARKATYADENLPF